jgi:hypothetical protein
LLWARQKVAKKRGKYEADECKGDGDSNDDCHLMFINFS